jgi:hypothetical protein
MSSHARFACVRRAAASVYAPRLAARLFGIGLATLFLAGCAAIAQNRLLAGADPSDPRSPSRPVGYRSSTAGYVSQRPVSPASWRQQNERVTPPPKSDQ